MRLLIFLFGVFLPFAAASAQVAAPLPSERDRRDAFDNDALYIDIGQTLIWPIESIQSNSAFSTVPRFLYVAEGTRWRDVDVTLRFRPDTEAYLGIWLNGERLRQGVYNQDIELSFPLENLSPGFHRIDFQIGYEPQPLSADDGGYAFDYCSAVLRVPVVITDISVQSRVEVLAEPPIAYVPDVLYNRFWPRRAPMRGAIQVDPPAPESLSAAARLSSVMQATAGLDWHEPGVVTDGPYDFFVSIERDRTLDAPARIAVDLVTSSGARPLSNLDDAFRSSSGVVRLVDNELLTSLNSGDALSSVPRLAPRLTLRYRTEDGLRQAIHALLNTPYRQQIVPAVVDISGAVEPPQWGEISEFTSLAELGIQDFRITGTSELGLFLDFPMVWEPTGQLTGGLVVRAEAGLLTGTKASIWIDNALAGSGNLSNLVAGDIQRLIPFQSDVVPRSDNITLSIDTDILASDGCDPNAGGAFWIDAKASRVTLPHRLKQGIVGIVPALVANPIVSMDLVPGATAALMAVAQVVGELTGNRPVPFLVEPGSLNNPPPLTITASPPAYRATISDFGTQIFPGFLGQGVVMTQNQNGYSLIGSSSEALALFAQYFDAALPEIQDGAETVVVSEEGEVRDLAFAEVVLEQPVFDTGDPLPWLLVSAAVFLILLAAIWFWLRSRRSD